MKRVSIAVAVLALAVPVGIAAAADDGVSAEYVQTMASLGANQAAPAGGADVAVGNVTGCHQTCMLPSQNRDIHFAATSNLNSGNANGVYVRTNPNGTSYRARVVCVSANGTVATIGMVVESGDVFAAGTEVLVSVYDNGRSGSPAADAFSFDYIDVPIVEADGQCLNGPFAPEFVVSGGDLKVHDGQAG